MREFALTVLCARANVGKRLDDTLEGRVAILRADDGHLQLLQVVDRARKLVVVLLRGPSIYDIRTEGGRKGVKKYF